MAEITNYRQKWMLRQVCNLSGTYNIIHCNIHFVLQTNMESKLETVLHSATRTVLFGYSTIMGRNKNKEFNFQINLILVADVQRGTS